MSVKITDNTPKILTETQVKGSIALRRALQAVQDKARPKTPYSGGGKGGHLRDSVIIQVLGLKGAIAWNKEYAKKQESTQYGHYTTAGTGPHFSENAIKDVASNMNKYFEGLI